MKNYVVGQTVWRRAISYENGFCVRDTISEIEARGDGVAFYWFYSVRLRASKRVIATTRIELFLKFLFYKLTK